MGSDEWTVEWEIRSATSPAIRIAATVTTKLTAEAPGFGSWLCKFIASSTASAVKVT